MKLELSKRMQVLADYVQEGDTAADIGTDHGYIPIWLKMHDICSKVIFADVNQGPLDRAGANAAAYLGKDFVPDLRLGSGIRVLKKGEADSVIIAGMGGILIRDILSEDHEKTLTIKRLILQPRSNSDVIRSWLRSVSGFTITSERVIKEGRKYSEIICAVRNDLISGDDPVLDRIQEARALGERLGIPYEFDLEVPCLYIVQKDPEAGDYLRQRLLSESRIRDSIMIRGRSDGSMDQLRSAEERITYLKKMVEAYDEIK